MHGQESAQKQWIQVVLEVSAQASTLSGTLSNITQRHHKFSQLKSQKAQLEKGIASHLKTVREQAHQLQGLAIKSTKWSTANVNVSQWFSTIVFNKTS